jgi:hypothetical protein
LAVWFLALSRGANLARAIGPCERPELAFRIFSDNNFQTFLILQEVLKKLDITEQCDFSASCVRRPVGHGRAALIQGLVTPVAAESFLAQGLASEQGVCGVTYKCYQAFHKSCKLIGVFVFTGGEPLLRIHEKIEIST